MKGLKKVSSFTKRLKGTYSEKYINLYYDTEKDEVFFREHVDYSRSAREVLPEGTKILSCGYIDRPKTMKEIKEIVKEKIKLKEEYKHRFMDYLETLE